MHKRVSMIKLISFGFNKSGVPRPVDALYDARWLYNPHSHKHLRNKTGLDKEVLDKMEATHSFCELRNKIYSEIIRLEFTKKNIVVAIGCGYGRHRSVALVESLRRMLQDHDVETEHTEL